MKSILFVCTGNTCRSPMAEFYFNDAVKIDGFYAVSGGIAVHGRGTMSKYSAQIISEAVSNADTTLFRSRQIDESMIAEAYRVYGITGRHADYLKEHFPQYSDRIFAMPRDISDPFNGSLDTYRRAFEDIRTAVDSIIGALDFSVTPMTADALTAVCEIERESFPDPWTQGMFNEILTSEYAVYVTIRTPDGEVAGYAGFYLVGNEAQIQNIAVAKKFRNKGFASRLLNYIIEYAKENSINVLTLEVRESNIAARSLYGKFGFKEVGVRKNYYRFPTENAILMDCEIENKEVD